MKLEVNITKARAFAIVGAILIFAGIFGVIAAVNNALPFHPASQVSLTSGKSLQEAVDDGSIGGGSAEIILDGESFSLQDAIDEGLVPSSGWGGREVTADSLWTEGIVNIDGNSFNVSGTLSGRVQLSSIKPIVAVRIGDMYTANGGVCSFSIVDSQGRGYFAGYSGYIISNPQLNISIGYIGGIGNAVYGGTPPIETFYLSMKTFESGGTRTDAATGAIRNGASAYFLPGKTLKYKLQVANPGQGMRCKIDVLYGTFT